MTMLPLPANSARLACRGLAVLVLMTATPGCWLAATMFGGEKAYQVEAQYAGLRGQTVAVMVAADEYLLFTQPRIREAVGRAVSGELAANVEGVTVANPARVTAFQEANPYWATTPYTELIDAIGAQRLVVIDLAEYRLHEPGNKHVWKGVAAGGVSVVEADRPDPDRLAFETAVRVEFPENTELGLIDANRQAVELATLKLFSKRVGRLFYDHEVRR